MPEIVFWRVQRYFLNFQIFRQKIFFLAVKFKCFTHPAMQNDGQILQEEF